MSDPGPRNADLRAALDDMAATRARFAAATEALGAGDMERGAPGGWTIGRVLLHVIESEATYAKLLAHQCGQTAPEIATSAPADGADAVTQLAATRAAVLALAESADDDALYGMVRIGHEEYSVLSVLQNVASHDRDHEEQIADLASRSGRAPKRAPASVTVRAGTEADLPRINEIYNHYIVHTAVSFDVEPYTLEQRQAWFRKYGTTGRHRMLVAEEAGVVLGYASTSPFQAKQSYETTVEMSIVCAPEAVGRGIGQRLYEEIFAAVRDEDIHLAVALITVPNPGSVALHERFGFERATVLREVGRKFGIYHDVMWMTRFWSGSR